MNVNVYNAVAALLDADASLSAEEKERILAVCKHPEDFTKPEERRLPRLLTINEAAKCLSISRCTVWRMTTSGRLRAIRFRDFGRPRYSVDDIEALINGPTPGAEGGVQ